MNGAKTLSPSRPQRPSRPVDAPQPVRFGSPDCYQRYTPPARAAIFFQQCGGGRRVLRRKPSEA